MPSHAPRRAPDSLSAYLSGWSVTCRKLALSRRERRWTGLMPTSSRRPSMAIPRQDQPGSGAGWGAGASTSADATLLRRFPGLHSLMKRAKRRIPRFAFDYLEGGVGDEICIERNRRALDAI